MKRPARMLLPLVPVLLLVDPCPAPAGDEEVRIVVYAAYGSPERLYVRGRALEVEERPPPREDDPAWRNLRRALSEWESDEVPGLRLRISWEGGEATAMTDEEGFLDLELAAPAGAPFRPEDPPLLRIAGMGGRRAPRPVPLEVRPEVLGPGALAVVSDLDDTVVESGLADRKAMLSRALLDNAAGLEPVPGVAALYREIRASRSPPVPVIYLSGSPVNLYDRLRAFLQIHGFPSGPMILKDLGRGGADPLLDQEAYKIRNLALLAERLPGVRFLLFGDSGQADARVFVRFRSERPGRVAGAFIRRLEAAPPSDPLPEGIHLTRHASEAARILAGLGLLEEEAVGAPPPEAGAVDD